MTDIQRYSVYKDELTPDGIVVCDNGIKEGQLLPEQIAGLLNRNAETIEAQAKEIECLKTELKKAQSKQADDDCKLCNWTCQKCGKYVEPENVLFDETHEGCGGICL